MGAEEFVKQDLRTMDPWRIIVDTARQVGTILNQPKENCKHCHGRGWIGRKADSGEPIPCKCIFPKQEFDRDIGFEERYMRPRNRAERRARKK